MNAEHPVLRQNIKKLYVVTALSSFGFSVPILFLFQQSLGLTLEEAFTIQAMYAAALVIFEVPSGYLSDRWGRKFTIIAGSASLFLGMIIYSLSTTFWAFTAAEIFLALGMSLHSGTIEALMYDTLLELREADQYRRIIGVLGFVSLASRSIIALLVGLIAVLNLRAPLWADVILFGSGLLLSLLLTEPHRHKLQGQEPLAAIWKICTHTLVHNVLLRSLILLYTVVAAINLMLFWFLQPYQNMVQLPLPYFGLVNALIFIGSALAAKYTYTVKHWISDRTFLFILSLIAVGSCVVLGFTATLWGITLFFVGETAFSAFETLTGDLINKATTSDMRATVLSLRSFTSRLFFAILSPILGYFADIYTLNQALLITGIIGLLALGLTFLLMLPTWRHLAHRRRHA
ncbi:MAG: MFS transporter [Candidatus Peribacteraceae bacterium]|nr:MFS transporter [Candidatus Peribacteraceae bacterium]